MKLEIYQVDAFTNRLFGGNPAAVVPLEQWLDESTMQNLSMENNLSETAFIAASSRPDADYDIRWFTPAVEINLCGHATLASAFVLFNKLGYSKDLIRFHSKSGILNVTRNGGKISMDFPAWKPLPLDNVNPDLLKSLGSPVVKNLYKHRDLLVELEDENAVKNIDPDFTLMKHLGEKLIVTAAGREVDFVSRFFAPSAGVNEDPVTGSAHAQLIPYWAEKLGKTELHALQLSKRGGDLWCSYKGDRVTIAGECVFYMKGEFHL